MLAPDPFERRCAVSAPGEWGRHIGGTFMADLSEDIIRSELRAIAGRHDVGLDVVEHLFSALVAGNGSQAQFNHPGLGGMGQWSRGGMLMIGDMFNQGLKAKVASLSSELADLASRAGLRSGSTSHQSQYQGGDAPPSDFRTARASAWWPAELGSPSATGAQNDMFYAFFPQRRRLALSLGGDVAVYDTGDHVIGGFSQQQSGDRSVTFSSQHGRIEVSRLEKVPVSGRPGREEPADSPAAEKPKAAASAHQTIGEKDPQTGSDGDIFDKIERLAALHTKGILSDQEFEAKKNELLARL